MASVQEDGFFYAAKKENYMKKEQFEIKNHWKQTGAGLILAHPDDEALMYGMMECLC